MNLLAHAHVCLATGHDDPDVVLGALLPDLVTMAGVHLDVAGLAPATAAGVHAHHLADGAFHGQRVFLEGVGAVRRALAEVVPPGAARAVGHVGWELLLDGGLVGGPAEAAYARALAHAGDDVVVAGVRADGRTRWRTFLARWGTGGVAAYAHPEQVAERLFHILARRPRLAFEAAHLGAVAAVLAEHQPAVLAAAPALLDATVAEVLRS